MGTQITHTITDPTGAVHTRCSSGRRYSHAVVAINSDGTWAPLTWCSRRDLAEKAMSQWRYYKEKKIVPVGSGLGSGDRQPVLSHHLTSIAPGRASGGRGFGVSATGDASMSMSKPSKPSLDRVYIDECNSVVADLAKQLLRIEENLREKFTLTINQSNSLDRIAYLADELAKIKVT